MTSSFPPALPRRSSRAADAADYLRQRLLAGAWPRQLPGEMDLSRQLQIGRNTLRAALAQLEDEGLVKTQMGRRREFIGGPTSAPQEISKTAVLLLGRPYHALAPSTLMWMEALRLHLQGTGWLLNMRVDSAAFRRAPASVLEALVADHPGAVWILHRSTAAMQQWFQNHGLPSVIAGSQHPGITLPQVDTDYRATSRHAAGRLNALGHRHVAVLTSRVKLAGDAESLAGFQEGSGPSVVEIATHNETPAGVIASLRPLFENRHPPTALFTLRAEHFATALTWLLQQGFRIPGQVSLLCRDDEPFLQHLHPEPARYRRSPEVFAKKLARRVTTCRTGLPKTHKDALLMPDFLRGETLGPPPKPAHSL